MKTKKCSKCGIEKDFTEFYKLASSPNGLQSRCKECAKVHYQQNKDILLEQHYRWIDNNRDRHNENHRKAYSKNAEKYRNYARKFYETVIGKLNNRVQQHKRRARKNGAQGTHTRKDIERIYSQQNGRCYWCGASIEKYHVDHVIPLSKGGSDAPENLVISCQTCNQEKYNKLPNEAIRQ